MQLNITMLQARLCSLHAKHPQVLLSPEPNVGCVAACLFSTEGQEGIHSQNQHWGVAGYQRVQPQGSSTSLQDLHSNIPNPTKNSPH